MLLICLNSRPFGARPSLRAAARSALMICSLLSGCFLSSNLTPLAGFISGFLTGMIADPSQERNAPETRHTSPPIELPHGFKKQRLEETKDSKKQRTYTKEDFRTAAL